MSDSKNFTIDDINKILDRVYLDPTSVYGRQQFNGQTPEQEIDEAFRTSFTDRVKKMKRADLEKVSADLDTMLAATRKAERAESQVYSKDIEGVDDNTRPIERLITLKEKIVKHRGNLAQMGAGDPGRDNEEKREKANFDEFSHIVRAITKNEEMSNHLVKYLELEDKRREQEWQQSVVQEKLDKENSRRSIRHARIATFGVLSLLTAVTVAGSATIYHLVDDDEKDKPVAVKKVTKLTKGSLTATLNKASAAKQPVAETKQVPSIKAQNTEETSVAQEALENTLVSAKTQAVESWKPELEAQTKDMAPATQEAFLLAMDYVQAYQAVLTARHQKNRTAELAASYDMRALKAPMKAKDPVVWDAMQNVGRLLVSMGKRQPDVQFDLKLVGGLIVKDYQTKVAAMQNGIASKEAETEQTNATPVLNSRNTYDQLPASYKDAVERGVYMIQLTNRWISYDMANAKDPRKDTIALEMQKVGKHIRETNPEMHKVILQTSKDMIATYQKEGMNMRPADLDDYRILYTNKAAKLATAEQLRQAKSATNGR